MKGGDGYILAKTLKEKLNPELIERILQDIGCHHIKTYSNRITAARPTGDNPSSVCCWTDNPQYNTEIYTKADYMSLKIKDIIAAVGYLLNLSFPQSMKKICDICEFDFYIDLNEPEKPAVLSFLDFIETGCKNETEIETYNILSEKVLNQFVQIPYQGWLKEGINYKVQKEYQVGFDIFSERVTLPVRNEIGDLIGIKGRAINEDAEDKYIALYPYPRGKILFGLYQNYQSIQNSDCVIVIESEKGILQAKSIGVRNIISLGSKTATENQIEQILRLNKPIVIGLDTDTYDKDDAEELAKQLSYPFKFNDIYVLKDDLGLYLNRDKKESPTDNPEFIKDYKNFTEKII